MDKTSLSINWLMSALDRKQTYMNCNENYKTFQKYHPFEPVINFIKLILPSIYSLSSSETEQSPPRIHQLSFYTANKNILSPLLKFLPITYLD